MTVTIVNYGVVTIVCFLLLVFAAANNNFHDGGSCSKNQFTNLYDDVNLRYKTGDIMFIVNITVKRP